MFFNKKIYNLNLFSFHWELGYFSRIIIIIIIIIIIVRGMNVSAGQEPKA